MTEHDSLLAENVQRILSAPTSEADFQSSKWPSPLWRELSNSGMAGVGTPEALGGSGGSLSDVSTLTFEVGRHAAMVPLVETMFAHWLSSKAQWMWSGGAETVAVATPGVLDVRENGTGLRVEGTVRDVPWARCAERVLLIVESAEGSMLIALHADEFNATTNENLASEPRDSVTVDIHQLSRDQWRYSPVSPSEVCARGGLLRSIAMAGAMVSILELTVSYACQREQFGRPLDRFQAVQQILARLASEVVASVTAARTASEALETREATVEVLAASVRVAQGATAVARLAHQVHGAMGITHEYPLHKFTNRLWSWRDEFGGENERCREIVEYIRGHGGPLQLWSLLTNNFEVQS
jgi:acyl-CoA dehydrogenase